MIPKQELMKEFILRYRDDPVGFAINCLQFEPLPWQEELFESVRNGDRLISIRAGHGVGKTAGVSVLALWVLVVANEGDCKIVVTAPTSNTLKDGLFAEMKKWLNRLPKAIRDFFEVQAERIYLKAAPAEVFCTSRVSSEQNPEALAGIHAKKVLIIVDEASGVPDPIFHTARGSMSSDGAQTILISNPTRNSGFFYETHTTMAERWKLMHVSCENNPRVSPEFKKEFVYGEADPQMQIRYYGNFPTTDENTLIPSHLVDSAMERDIQLDMNTPLIYGIDVARQGTDRSVLVKRRGNVVIDWKIWKVDNHVELMSKILFEAQMDNPDEVLIDSIGMGGTLGDFLRDAGLNVRDVNVAETSSLNEKCSRMRDALWVALRDWLNTKSVSIPKDNELRQELVTPRLEYLANGKMKVEGKDSLKKRMNGKSPDIADALCLTFASLHARVGGRSTRWVKGTALKRNVRAVV